MPVVLITGANRGIGLEFARQYHANGWHVIATCRMPDAAEDLATLGVETWPLDVTDTAAIAALARGMAGRSLDLLVNNAGVYGPRGAGTGAVEPEAMLETLRTNAVAPVILAQAFADLLAADGGGTLVSVSSKMGSIAENTSGGSIIYRSSKAALNAAMKSVAIDLAPRKVIVAVVHPGWVQTAMGGPDALIDTATSVAGMRSVIAGLTPDRAGRFWNYDGTEIPW